MKITRTINVVKITANITIDKESFYSEKLLSGNVNIRQAINAFKSEYPNADVITDIQIIAQGEKKYSMDIDKFIEYATVEEE